MCVCVCVCAFQKLQVRKNFTVMAHSSCLQFEKLHLHKNFNVYLTASVHDYGFKNYKYARISSCVICIVTAYGSCLRF